MTETTTKKNLRANLNAVLEYVRYTGPVLICMTKARRPVAVIISVETAREKGILESE